MALVYSNWSFLIQESFRNGDFPRVFFGALPGKVSSSVAGKSKKWRYLSGKIIETWFKITIDG